MWKSAVVLLSLFAFCCCEEQTEIAQEETRAKKKKGSAKLLSIILLLAFAKLAVFKVVSIFMLSMFFQKVLAVGGLLFNNFLKPKPQRVQTSYGPPDYNTLGYSYGPPVDGPAAGGPAAGGPLSEPSLEWLFNKNKELPY